MTFVYSPARQPIVEIYEEAIIKNGGEMCYVRLYCKRATLTERVENEDRREYGKIVDAARLNETLQKFEKPFAEIEKRESLSLDVGKMQPVEAAEAIKRHYHLPQART